MIIKLTLLISNNALQIVLMAYMCFIQACVCCLLCFVCLCSHEGSLWFLEKWHLRLSIVIDLLLFDVFSKLKDVTIQQFRSFWP